MKSVGGSETVIYFQSVPDCSNDGAVGMNHLVVTSLEVRIFLHKNSISKSVGVCPFWKKARWFKKLSKPESVEKHSEIHSGASREDFQVFI